MALNLRLIGATGLVATGIAAAAIVGQLPALGVEDDAVVVTPSSAPQSLVCPGSAVAVGAEGTGATEFSASGKPQRVSGTAGGAKPTTTALGAGAVTGGAGPRALSAATALRTGAIAGAQIETTTGDAVGLVATACTTPLSDLWLAAGATTTGRTTVLSLANASSVAAQATVRVWTEEGPVAASTAADVTVPARGRALVSLAGIAPSAGGTVVRVVSTGGRVAAALEQRTVRGLESGGADMTGPTAPPARTQVVAGVRVAEAAAIATAAREDDSADLQPVVRVLVPGRAAADVSITVTPADGGDAVRLGRRVAAGVVTDFAVPGLADGTYVVRVTGSRPLVTGVRTSTIGDPGASTTPDDATTGTAGTDGGSDAAAGNDAGLVGGDGPADADTSGATTDDGATASATSTARGVDLAWFAAAPALSATGAIAIVDAPSPVLTIVNPGEARTVRLTGAVSAIVRLPSRGSASIGASPGVVVLHDAAGTWAGVSFAGARALAGYPAAAADQRATAVRITR